MCAHSSETKRSTVLPVTIWIKSGKNGTLNKHELPMHGVGSVVEVKLLLINKDV